jgi:hypothetical protein
MLDANTRQIIAELNTTVAGLSEAIDNLCAIIAELRFENGRLRLELSPPDLIERPWLPVGQA